MGALIFLLLATAPGAFAASLASLTCSPTTIGPKSSTACTARATANASRSGLTVILSSSSSVLKVPSTVKIASGTKTVSFSATSSSFTSSQNTKVTATLSGQSKSVTVNLAATQVTPALSSLSCGSASITGAGTDSCTITLTASAPTGGCAVSLASNNVALVVPLSVSVAAGSTSASFTASAAAVSSAQTATVTSTVNGIARTFAVQLNLATQVLTINATTVSFGSVALKNQATQTVTLTSSGTLPVTVSSATLTGTGFSLSCPTLPATLSPGQSIALNVAFDPTTAGSATGQLTVVSNSSTASSVSIALRGVGVSYAVGLAWDAPISSSDPVAGFHVYRTSNGTSYQLLTTLADIQTTYIDSAVLAGGSYQYYVTSVDAVGVESLASNSAIVAVP